VVSPAQNFADSQTVPGETPRDLFRRVAAVHAEYDHDRRLTVGQGGRGDGREAQEQADRANPSASSKHVEPPGPSASYTPAAAADIPRGPRATPRRYLLVKNAIRVAVGQIAADVIAAYRTDPRPAMLAPTGL
jgi:hypothetical protein